MIQPAFSLLSIFFVMAEETIQCNLSRCVDELRKKIGDNINPNDITVNVKYFVFTNSTIGRLVTYKPLQLGENNAPVPYTRLDENLRDFPSKYVGQLNQQKQVLTRMLQFIQRKKDKMDGSVMSKVILTLGDLETVDSVMDQSLAHIAIAKEGNPNHPNNRNLGVPFDVPLNGPPIGEHTYTVDIDVMFLVKFYSVAHDVLMSEFVDFDQRSKFTPVEDDVKLIMGRSNLGSDPQGSVRMSLLRRAIIATSSQLDGVVGLNLWDFYTALKEMALTTSSYTALASTLGPVVRAMESRR